MNSLCGLLDPYLSCDACGISVCEDITCPGDKWTYHEIHLGNMDLNICPLTGKSVRGVRPNNNRWLRFVLCPITNFVA